MYITNQQGMPWDMQVKYVLPTLHVKPQNLKRTLNQLNSSESKDGDSLTLTALSIAGLSTDTDAASPTSVFAVGVAIL